MKSKNGFSYFPWAAAFAEIAKKVPDVTYEICRYGEDSLPYVASELGIMVSTRMTVDGVTREMQLPVMDATNRALKTTEQTIETKSGKRTIPAATMADVNKSIMRCLAKNCAMFGVGLHLWLGEDVPEAVSELLSLQEDCMELIKKRASLSDKAKKQVEEVCKSADQNANGDPRLIGDRSVLEDLKLKLAGIRK